VLEVLHQRRRHLGQPRVQRRRLLQVAVEDLHERGVELGLALEHGGEQLPALVVDDPADTALVRRAGQLPPAIELRHLLRQLGWARGGHGQRGQAVEGGQERRVRALLFVEARAQRGEVGVLVHPCRRFNHGGSAGR
jgi:hypothetical protein